MKKPFSSSYTSKVTLDQKNLVGLSMLLLLAIDFTLGYVVFTFYPDDLLQIESPGFWFMLLNYSLITLIVLLNKWVLNWSWRDLGLARPESLWKFVFVTVATFGVILIFALYLQPLIIQEFGKHQNLEFLSVIRGNFPALISALILIWITAAFIEELVFRAYLINTLNLLLGDSIWALVGSVLISALVFGGIHAYQGITGILITTCLGIIFGVFYLFNGRRIWPLILIHGILDTITLIGIYNS